MAATTELVREKQINIRMSAEEADRLERVAQHHEWTVAQLIRDLVKQEAARLGIELDAKAAKKGKR